MGLFYGYKGHFPKHMYVYIYTYICTYIYIRIHFCLWIQWTFFPPSTSCAACTILYFRKRALCIPKRAPYIRQRELYMCTYTYFHFFPASTSCAAYAVLYIRKRDLYIRKRVPYTVRVVYLRTINKHVHVCRYTHTINQVYTRTPKLNPKP